MTVYFLRAGATGPIKIGSTENVTVRTKAIQNNHWEELILLAVLRGGVAKEESFHALFSAHRIRGEWFYPNAEILKFCENHIPSQDFLDDDMRLSKIGAKARCKIRLSKIDSQLTKAGATVEQLCELVGMTRWHWDHWAAGIYPPSHVQWQKIDDAVLALAGTS